jgi:glucokinase
MKDDSRVLVLGIDLGGTKILSAVVDEEGKIVSRDHSVTPAAKGQAAVMQAIQESVQRALSSAEIDVDRLAAIGIGAPGPSNPEKGILYTSPNLPGWEDVPITKVMHDTFGRRVFLINDANAAALAEYRFGAGQGSSHLIYITISTGIGGGIVLDGRLYIGSIGTAGELGHMTIDHQGPACNCGNIGCWETLASGTALAKEAQKRLRDHAESAMRDMVSGRLELVSAEVVQKAAEQGDELAQELIRQTAYYVGVGLANIINIFNPDAIVIGGGVSNMGDRLLAPAIKTAEERAHKMAFRSVRFAVAGLGRNSGVLGAAALALERVA